MWKVSPKWRAITGISAGLLVLLFQFQNCAPAVETAAAPTDPFDGEVRVIEDWSTEKVDILGQVLQSDQTGAKLRVDGFCARKMAPDSTLTWAVRADDDAVLLTGAVHCEGGGFRVEISNLDGLTCGEAYSLEVSTDEGFADQAVVIRRCAL